MTMGLPSSTQAPPTLAPAPQGAAQPIASPTPAPPGELVETSSQPNKGAAAAGAAAQQLGKGLMASGTGDAYSLIFGHMPSMPSLSTPHISTTSLTPTPAAVGPAPAIAPQIAVSDARAKRGVRDGHLPVMRFLDALLKGGSR